MKPKQLLFYNMKYGYFEWSKPPKNNARTLYSFYLNCYIPGFSKEVSLSSFWLTGFKVTKTQSQQGFELVLLGKKQQFIV